MKSFKLIIQVLLIATVAASVTACSSKKGSKTQLRGSRVGDFGGNGTAPHVSTGTSWGQITGFTQNDLYRFLGTSEGIGQVSSYPNQPTGIRFYGDINNAGKGYIEVFIFDGQPNPLRLATYQCQGVSYGSQLTLECTNAFGVLTFSGYEAGNNCTNLKFTGQVKYDGYNSLGQFEISSCGLFRD